MSCFELRYRPGETLVAVVVFLSLEGSSYRTVPNTTPNFLWRRSVRSALASLLTDHDIVIQRAQEHARCNHSCFLTIFTHLLCSITLAEPPSRNSHAASGCSRGCFGRFALKIGPSGLRLHSSIETLLCNLKMINLDLPLLAVIE